MVCSVRKIENLARETLLVEFEAKNRPDFSPGQYIQLVLPGGLKHYFSIVNSPKQKHTFTIATRLRNSPFKTVLRQLKTGDEVEINGPWGDMVLPRDASKRLIILAGGIGITPFISILRYLKEKNEKRDVNLLYFNRSRESAVFFDELREFADLKFIPLEGEKISKKVLQGHFKNFSDYIYLLAGPPGFVTAGIAALVSIGIPQSLIIHESYTGYS